MAPDTKLGSQIRNARREGAKKVNEIKSKASAEKHKYWQGVAITIWDRSPYLSKTATANIIAKQAEVENNKFKGCPNSIRLYIEKP